MIKSIKLYPLRVLWFYSDLYASSRKPLVTISLLG